MERVILNDGQFVTSNSTNSDMIEFLRRGVSNFFEELAQYINSNNDSDIVYYGTERTMASLFVSGNLRRNKELTGIQEYGTICNRDGRVVHGRPDIFIKSGENAIWIECKYENNIMKLNDDHWDIPAWLEWDKKNAYAQVETYYNSEAEKLNDCYKKRYLMTLYFKLINENRDEHESKVRTKLVAKSNEACDRLWYYQVGFFPSQSNEIVGMEVYGTCSDDLSNPKK